MKKIEYMETSFKALSRPHYGELDIDKLKELGVDGWELITIVSGMCIFKREVNA